MSYHPYPPSPYQAYGSNHYYQPPAPAPTPGGGFGYIDAPPPPMNSSYSYGQFPSYPMQPQPMMQPPMMQQPMMQPAMQSYHSMPMQPQPMMQQPMMQSMPMYSTPPVMSAAAAPAAMVRPYGSPMQYSTMYSFQFRGRKLDRKDIFSPSDPFLTLSAPTGTISNAKKMKKQYDAAKKKKRYRDPSKKGKWTVVFKSEVIKNKANPVWKPFDLSLQILCKGSLDIPFLIEVWDWDPNGNHDFIGRAQTTLRELQVMKEVQLINKHRFGFGHTAGLLEVLKCQPM
eukprot:TRINITY_DN178_c0_g1_i1.p1 TRINITY_DN178_c0_g1~~TRINITY_DN178_c0_g1_i1.p1  ORF type:complete len:284 (+),score=63.35 TRINITY_DN178_c0_g1_i1:263-1114(+)